MYLDILYILVQDIGTHDDVYDRAWKETYLELDSSGTNFVGAPFCSKTRAPAAATIVLLETEFSMASHIVLEFSTLLFMVILTIRFQKNLHTLRRDYIA